MIPGYNSNDSIDMQSTLFPPARNVICASRPLFTSRTFIRNSSIESSSAILQLQTSLHEDLTNRKSRASRDYLSPMPSHLLNISLADLLPQSCYPEHFKPNKLCLEESGTSHRNILPQGHHIVYFPPLILQSDLLPDGTDILHSPGPPFNRRMWAGGSLEFNDADSCQLRLDGDYAEVQESISNVMAKGVEGDEKVFVTIQRDIAHAFPTAAMKENTKTRREKAKDYIGSCAIIERRNIVFMREKSVEDAREDVRRGGKVVKRIYLPFRCSPLTRTNCLNCSDTYT